MKRALITGISGQDGWFLARHLLSLGYEVAGTSGVEVIMDPSLRELVDAGVKIEVVDMRDRLALESTFSKVWPDEVYNLAAQSFPPMGWSHPAETLAINAGGFALLLEITKRQKPETRVFQASTSEMYGNFSGPCDEKTVFRPNSLYGISKLAAHMMCRMYRDMGMYVVSAVLFNHESERRPGNIVTQKVARAVAAWSLGEEFVLELGSLDSKRDWGYAQDYVEAMHLMLNQDIDSHPPRDYIIGSGESHSLGELIQACCTVAGLGRVPSHLIKRNEKFVRPDDGTRNLYSSPAKAIAELGWKQKIGFHGMCERMVDAQIAKQKSNTKAPVLT